MTGYSLGESLRTPTGHCLGCGKPLDAAACVDESPEGQKPSPGDFTVCLYCGHLMVFAEDLTPRPPNEEEIADIAGDGRLLAIQWARGKTETKH